MTVRRTEALGEIDTLVDDDLVRNIDATLQFEHTDQENAELNRIQLLERAIDQPCNGYFEIGLRFADIFERLIEKRLVNALIRRLLVKLCGKFVAIIPGDLLLIQRLQYEFARTRTGTA